MSFGNFAGQHFVAECATQALLPEYMMSSKRMRAEKSEDSKDTRIRAFWGGQIFLSICANVNCTATTSFIHQLSRVNKTLWIVKLTEMLRIALNQARVQLQMSIDLLRWTVVHAGCSTEFGTTINENNRYTDKANVHKLQKCADDAVFEIHLGLECNRI